MGPIRGPVILLVLSFVILIAAVLRGARSLRMAAILGASLIIGYLLFAFVDKWGLYDARYGLPLLVTWSALIALALSRFPRFVCWIVAVALVLACLPQLVNSQSRPLETPASYDSSYLEPYFVSCCTDPQTLAVAYETITADLAESSCNHAAIANWILYEYPLWTGLSHNSWKGTLYDTDVKNATKRFEPTEPPCATLTQQGPHYRTPDNGTVNLQLSDLALSIDADKATTMHTAAPRFTSSLPGVMVWPGGGWLLTAFGGLPVLVGNGSVYIASQTDRSVQLEIRLPANARQPTPTVIGTRWQPGADDRHRPRRPSRSPGQAGMNRVGLELAVESEHGPRGRRSWPCR